MEHLENELIPPMTTVRSGIEEEVASDILCLTTQIVNICMIGEPRQNSNWLLVDAGMPHSAELIIETAERRFGKNNPPNAIVLTHGHFDHIGAITELIEYWKVKVFAHEDELPFLIGKANYPEGDTEVKGLVAKLSPLFPNHGVNLENHIQALPSNGSIPGMADWCWLHTPGHTPGHISLLREKDKTIIVGDAFTTVKQESLYHVIMQDTVVSGPPAYFTMDWNAAWDSVKKIEAFKPKIAVTGHGAPIEGDYLRKELSNLAQNFSKIAIPAHKQKQ